MMMKQQASALGGANARPRSFRKARSIPSSSNNANSSKKKLFKYSTQQHTQQSQAIEAQVVTFHSIEPIHVDLLPAFVDGPTTNKRKERTKRHYVPHTDCWGADEEEEANSMEDSTFGQVMPLHRVVQIMKLYGFPK